MNIVDSLIGFINEFFLHVRSLFFLVFFCFLDVEIFENFFLKKKDEKEKLVELNFHYRNKIFQNLLNFFIKKWQNFTPKNTHKTHTHTQNMCEMK
jgi:hypothetical protein